MNLENTLTTTTTTTTGNLPGHTMPIGEPEMTSRTIAELFPGNMGRVWMTRVALRLRMPDLMKRATTETLEPELQARLAAALIEVKKG